MFVQADTYIHSSQHPTATDDTKRVSRSISHAPYAARWIKGISTVHTCLCILTPCANIR